MLPRRLITHKKRKTGSCHFRHLISALNREAADLVYLLPPPDKEEISSIRGSLKLKRKAGLQLQKLAEATVKGIRRLGGQQQDS